MFGKFISLLQHVWSISLLAGVVISFLVFKTSMKTVIKMFTFPLAVSFYRNLFLYSDLRIAHILANTTFPCLLFSLFGFIVLCPDLDKMVKTGSGNSSKKRSFDDLKTATSTSKRPRRDLSPSSPQVEPPVALSVVTEAMKPLPPPVPKGMRQKA